MLFHVVLLHCFVSLKIRCMNISTVFLIHSTAVGPLGGFQFGDMNTADRNVLTAYSM